MSRPDSPITGEALADVFTAIQNSPLLRQQLHQLMQASPVSPVVSSVPSDLTTNHRIMATIISTAVDSIATAFPTLADTHSWYSGIAPLIGVCAQYPPLSFVPWVHPPRVLSHSEQAAECLRTFTDKHLFALFEQDLPPNHPNLALIRQQIHSDSTPPPKPSALLAGPPPMVYALFLHYLGFLL